MRLRPGGWLVVATPHMGALWRPLMGRRWPWYMRMHFYYFGRGSMARMLESAGFKVLAIERHKRIISLRYFVEKAASMVPGFAALGRALASPFGSWYITVDLGDVMNVFAVRSGEES